jgi:predicted O-linked N-acetylglucosamine transferase (SPINDLY family)
MTDRLADATQALRAGHRARAEQLCEGELRARPGDPLALSLLAVVYGTSGRAQMAVEVLRRVIDTKPTDAVAHNNLGNALLALGRASDAVVAYREAARLAPGYVTALCNLGQAYMRIGSVTDAEASFRAALLQAPTYAPAHYELGNAMRALGQHESALACYRQAVHFDPRLAPAHNNIGALLMDCADTDGAVVAFRAALDADPAAVGTLGNLAGALLRQQNYRRAIPVLERLLKMSPDDPIAWNNLGSALCALGAIEESLTCCRRAAKLMPSLAEAHANIGLALQMKDELSESIASYDRALASGPLAAEARLGRLVCRLSIWDHREAEQETAYCRDRVQTGKVVNPLLFMTVCADSAEQRRCAQRYATWVGTEQSSVELTAAVARRATDQPLRVGFLSPDLRDHVVGRSIVELLERFDRARVTAIGLHTGPSEQSATSLRIVGACSEFHRVAESDDEAIAELIRARKLDIVVDLVGFGALSRPRILIARPAPIQVNFLGFAGTLGAPWIDYILADPFLIPATHAADYSEQIVWMPNSFMPADTSELLGEETPARSDEGLPERGFVFAAFNNPARITPEVFADWLQILRAVPESVLWLRRGKEGSDRRMQAQATQSDIDPSRLIFARAAEPRSRHLLRHRCADLMLDTYPYNMHSTCRDALWAGLPVLTRSGRAFSSRVAGSLLRAAGLNELITESAADYVSMAIALAHNSQALSELKSRLAEAAARARLFDMAAYARHFESALAVMHERACAGVSPTHIRVQTTLQ